MPLEQTKTPPTPSAGMHQSRLNHWLGWLGQGGNAPNGSPNAVARASPSSIAAPEASRGPAQTQNQAGHNHAPTPDAIPGRITTNGHPPVPSFNGQQTIPPSSSLASYGQRPPAQPLSQPSMFPPRSVNTTNTTSTITIPHTTGFTRPQLPQPQSWSGMRGALYPPAPARGPATTSNTRQSIAPSYSAMELDELANTDEEEDDDPVPLVTSDLKPPRGRTAGARTLSADTQAHKKSPISSPSSQLPLNPSLRSPSSQPLRKTAAPYRGLGTSTTSSSTTTSTKARKERNGTGKTTPATLPLASPSRTQTLQQPVVSIPLARPPSSSLAALLHTHSHQAPSLSSSSSSQPQHPATPSKATTTTVPFSVSIPIFSPSGRSTSKPKPNDGSMNSHLPTLRSPMAQAQPLGDSHGRRTSNGNNNVDAFAANATTARTAPGPGPQPLVQIKGGRPKGWKPGMSYREVALRNMGVDTSDPTVPPEFLMSRRDRRAIGSSDNKRPSGRPRVHGGSSSSSGGGGGGGVSGGGPNGGTRKAVGRPRLHKTAKERAVFAKRIGRPPLQSVEEMQRKIFRESTVHFMPFLCEWAGCRAELQNLATLRRHIEVVHGRGGKPSKASSTTTTTTAPPTCLWRKCATRTPPVQFAQEGDGSSSGGGSSSSSSSTSPKMRFMEHMEYYHLEPLSWHQGDGFANNSHIGPPAPPVSIVLAQKEAKLGKEPPAPPPPAKAEDDDAQYLIKCATTVTPDMTIRVPVEDLPGYLLEGGRQVTPLLRDAALEKSSAFWSADEWDRRVKEAYRQQNRRPERGRMV